MIVLSFKARLKPFAPPYFLIWYLHYYGSADYPFIIFLTVPFRCRPSPITTKRWAVHLYQSGCLNTVLKFFDCHFPLIFWAFLPFRFSVVLFLNHKNRCFLLLRFKLQSLKNVSHNTLILKQSNSKTLFPRIF